MIVTEASTIPLTVLAAALPLFRRQNLPMPWSRRSSNAEPLPLIIYGASSALGTFAVKLALLANIHPIIAICGSTTLISSLLKPELGDAVVDYRAGPEAMKSNVKKALNGLEAYHALDAISENGSWIHVSQMVCPNDGYVSVVQGGPPEKYSDPEIPRGVEIGYTYVGSAHHGSFLPSMPKQPKDKDSVTGDVDFAYVLMRYVSHVLASGDFRGHPVEIIPGGLAGVEAGLQKLQRGEAKGVKYIYRIEETPGLVGEA